MAQNPAAVAVALQDSIGLCVRRLKRVHVDGDITIPESSALAQLDRGGPTTAAALARCEQISPQSMGATLATLEARGLVERRSDPTDGRRSIISLTAAGRAARRDHRSARARQLTRALTSEFTPAELDQLAAVAPLIDRLARAI